MILLEYPTVHLRPGADKRVRAGHLWVFSNELEDGFQNLSPGEPVQLADWRGQVIGTGTINPHSLIAVRIFTRRAESLGRELLGRRLDAAIALRQRLFPPSEEAYRVVFSESDGLPGLIVDRFRDVIVLQSTTAGMDRLLPEVVPLLIERFSPRTVIAANDAPVRELEGLQLMREVVEGALDGPVEFVQDEIHFLSDPLAGQKTGFFLDQRFNRRLLVTLLPRESRVLDLFSYSGGFGGYALKAGAAHVTFVDSSQHALDLARQTTSLNRWSEHAEFVKADVFDYLKKEPQLFDAVLLDPPALAKSRAKLAAAERAYRDLNARAMERVRPGGLLATSSCSGLVSLPAWREALRLASVKSGRRLRILAQGGQAPDHPILSAMPETEYLKFAIGVVD